MTPELTVDVALEDEPISLELAWTQLALDTDGSPPESAFDTWLEAVGLPAAREAAENFTGRAFGVKTYRMRAATFPSSITIPIVPLRSVEISYLDADSTLQTLGSGDFEIDDTGVLPVLTPTVAWPATDGSAGAVTVTFEVGYTPDAVPRQALLAMLLILGHAFKNREAVTDRELFTLPLGADFHLRPFRVRLGMA